MNQRCWCTGFMLGFVVMPENPYASSSDVPETQGHSPFSRKMLWLGLLILLVSFLFFCFLVSELLTPQLNDDVSAAGLAKQVSGAVSLLPVAFLAGLIGLIFTVVGLVRSGKRVPRDKVRG